MTKADIIKEMLREYHEAQNTLNSRSDFPGDGGSVQLMPPTWNTSYKQLEQLLQYMYYNRPRQHWHTTQRYLIPQPVRRTLHLDHRDRLQIPHHSELVSRTWTKNRDRTVHVLLREWNPKVKQQVAEDGIRWLADRFTGEPFLHPELRRQEALAA